MPFNSSVLQRNIFIYEKVLSLCREVVSKARVIFSILEMRPHSDRRLCDVGVINLQVVKQSTNVYKIRVCLYIENGLLCVSPNSETEESEHRQCFMIKAGVLLCLSRVADEAFKV